MRGLGGPGDHPDQLEVFHRAQIRLLSSDGDSIVPIAKPNVETEMAGTYLDIGEYVSAGVITPPPTNAPSTSAV